MEVQPRKKPDTFAETMFPQRRLEKDRRASKDSLASQLVFPLSATNFKVPLVLCKCGRLRAAVR